MNKLLKSIELRKQQLYKTDEKPLSNIENKTYSKTYLVDNILLSSSEGNEDIKNVSKPAPLQEKLSPSELKAKIFDGIVTGTNPFTMFFEDGTKSQAKHSSKHNLLLLYQRFNQYYGTTKVPVRIEDGWLINSDSQFINTIEEQEIKCIKKSDVNLPEGMILTNEGFLTGLDAKEYLQNKCENVRELESEQQTYKVVKKVS